MSEEQSPEANEGLDCRLTPLDERALLELSESLVEHRWGPELKGYAVRESFMKVVGKDGLGQDIYSFIGQAAIVILTSLPRPAPGVRQRAPAPPDTDSADTQRRLGPLLDELIDLLYQTFDYQTFDLPDASAT